MKIRMTYHLPPYQESVYRHRKQNSGYQRGKGRDESGTGDWHYTLLYIKQMNNKASCRAQGTLVNICHDL